MNFHKLLLQARGYTKRPANDYDKAVELCKAFCKLNKMPIPLFKEECEDNRGLYLYFNYRPSVIMVGPPHCRWSWWSKPGNKADVTTFGVMVHELGHHWHHVKFRTLNHGLTAWEKGCYPTNGRAVGGKHKSITTYAKTSTTEQLAEAFRLFVLNPQRLLELSPASARFFVAHGLRHPELRRKVRT